MLNQIIEDGKLERFPEVKTQHLHVYGSADTDDLTPPTGKRICVYGVSDYTISITAATNATISGTLSFGTGAMTDHTKVIISAQKDSTGEGNGGNISGIRVIGEVNEILRLTNMTFTTGTAALMINVYYQFI